MTNSTFTFAQVQRTSSGIENALNNFFASPIGGVVDSVLDVVAIGLVVYAVFVIVKAMKSPNPGAEILKKGLWQLFAAALVLQLNWTTKLIGIIQKAISAAFDSVVNLIPGLG